MKKITLIFILIVISTMSACNSKQVVENNATVVENKVDSTYDLNVAIKNAKCVTEYPDTATVDDFDTVKFGKYEQDGNECNGKENIEWCIIDKNDKSALLLSKYILDCKKYNDEYKDNMSWKDSSIRKWLNNNFFNDAFGSEDKLLIVEVNNSNNNCNEYSYNLNHNFENTKDRVFLLSPDEIIEHFIKTPDEAIKNYKNEGFEIIEEYFYDNRIATKGTNYSKKENDNCKLKVLDIDTWDWGEGDVPEYMYNGNSTYWCRSIGSSTHLACSVFYDGYLKTDGNPVNVDSFGVRPAMWVKYK